MMKSIFATFAAMILCESAAVAQEKLIYTPAKSINGIVLDNGNFKITGLNLGDSSLASRKVLGKPSTTIQRGEGMKEAVWYEFNGRDIVNESIQIIYASDKAIQITVVSPQQINITLTQLAKKFKVERVSAYRHKDGSSDPTTFFYEVGKKGISFVVADHASFDRWREIDGIVVHRIGKRVMQGAGYFPVRQYYKKGERSGGALVKPPKN